MGGPRQSDKKNSDVFCFLFAFFLVLRLFNNLTEVKWLISKKNIIFQGSGGGTNFSRRGGGGVSDFFQGEGSIAYSL